VNEYILSIKRNMKKLLGIIFVLIFNVVSFAQPTIVTKFGVIKGNNNGSILEFLGIPFAKPPIDSLRWKPPQDPDYWIDTLLCQSFKPGCIQKDFQQGSTSYTIKGSEDCLYLNIWTPDSTASLPVMVFIHGGGNQQGAASDTSGGTEIYNGKNLSGRGNAVVVTIDYRLGPFGFLVHPGLEDENNKHISGNYALMDQIKALQWVHNNISLFGGDTSRVMIFGESAGGLDIGDLLLSPLAAGLFQRACIESAVPSVTAYDSAKAYGIQFVNQFISTGSDSEKISYMRSLPADSLIKYITNALAGGIVQSRWRPVIDNYVITGTPQQVFTSGNFNKVPLLIGSNADEMSLSAPQTVYPSMVTALIKKSVPPSDTSEGLSLYPPGSTNSEARDSYVQILTDAQFTSTVRRTVRWVSENQTQPVWRYFLTYTQSGILSAAGSYHGIELFYVFNNWENAPLGTGPLFTAQDDSMQKNMLAYWVNFAAGGNPNGQALVQWPQYAGNTDPYLEVNATPNGTQTGVRTIKCDFWDQAEGFVTGIENNNYSTLPRNFILFQNYPNPFNPSTTINYTLPSDSKVIIKIYNILGQKLMTLLNNTEAAGTHQITFNAGNLPSGIYLYRIQAEDFTQTKKMILLK
jgi:para-nitrobenzyl esterase